MGRAAMSAFGVIALAVVAASTSCSGDSGVQRGGELVIGGNGVDSEPQAGYVIDEPIAETCFSGAHMDDEWVTVSAGVISNVADRATTITSVTVLEGANFEVTEASLFALPEQTADGSYDLQPANGPGYPSTGTDPAAWDERIPAAGTTVLPGESWALGVVLEYTARSAYAKQIRVEYGDEHGGAHEIFTAGSIRVDSECDGADGT